ncbi:MAG: thioredoxin [Bacteroidales bacterium]|jgi:thioredoxin 1|nr:thioredoxin [Bacteroidales bacterium]
MALTIDSTNFDSLVSGEQLVVIDFWAPWCGPCRALAPVIEELAKEYEGKAIIGKCDTDENNEIAVKFGVRNIPMLVFLKGGEVKDTLVGAVPKAKIAELINKHL